MYSYHFTKKSIKIQLKFTLVAYNITDDKSIDVSFLINLRMTVILLFSGGIIKMQITDIKVRKFFDEGPMKAVVSVTFDGQLAVHDIKVINAKEKLFIVMPSRKNPDETYRDIVHPINSQFRTMLEAAVISAYEEALANQPEQLEPTEI